MAGSVSGKFDYAFFVNLECKGKKNVLDWCMSMGLICTEHKCPNCKSPMILEEKTDDIDGFIWVCRQEGENEHVVERTVRQGSFFERSNLSFITIFLMTYLWIKKAPSEFIEDELSLPTTTVVDWITFCQEVCVVICVSKNTMIGGQGLVVEINESKLIKKRFVKRHSIACKWVYVGFEKETDKGFFIAVEKRNKKALYEVIKEYVLPGSILVSECWKEYDCLDDDMFLSLTEDYDIKFEDLGVGVYGSSIIGMRRSIKRTFNDIKRFSSDFDLFLAEYMFRRTNSDNPYHLMRSFLEEITVIFPPNVKD